MLPLTPSQQIVWLHEELFPDSPAYNFTAVLDLTGPLDVDALRRSMAAVLDRHAGLRLEVLDAEPAPAQRVRPRCEPRFRAVSLAGRPDAGRRFQDLLREHHDAPFTRTEAPLLRWTLVELGTDRYRLLHTEHHLVHDGRSFAVVLRDLFGTYTGLAGGLAPALPHARSYEDYVRLLGEPGRSEHLRRAIAHWRRELTGASLGAALPGLERAGGPRLELDGGQVRHLVDAELTAGLSAAARRHGHTVFSTLLCLFAELVRRLTGQGDLVVGTAVGNRPPGFENTVGMFVNTIPLRLRLDETAPAVEAVDEVTDVLLRCLPYQDTPVQDITRALGLHTAGGVDNPLFQLMFSANDARLPDIDVPGLDVSLVEAFNSGTSRFDLDAVLLPGAERRVGPRQEEAGMTLIWDYAADLFEHAEVGELCAHFLGLVAAYVAVPSRPLGDLARGGGS